MAIEQDMATLRRAVEQVIDQLQGVLASRVMLNGSKEIVEVHVLANYDRSPKQLVRDIESALMTQLGLEVDYKKISVAQVKRGKTDFFPVLPSRIQFCDVSLSVSGLTAEVQVKLKKDDVISDGVATGPSSKENHLRLIARATIKAVAKFLAPNRSLVLEEIVSISFKGEEIVLAVVTSLTVREEMKLVGCAFVNRSVERAVVFATLDALNRLLSSTETMQ